MSHRKVYSQGSIPFSWEDKPGISKVTLQDFPTNSGLKALDLTSPSTSPSPSFLPNKPKESNTTFDIKIPPPPCPSQPPSRSASAKGLKWQQAEDPFLMAYKECTKSVKVGKLTSENKKGFLFLSKIRKTMFMFSCKSSCSDDVRNDNFVKLSHLPPLPTHRVDKIMLDNF